MSLMKFDTEEGGQNWRLASEFILIRNSGSSYVLDDRGIRVRFQSIKTGSVAHRDS
jgi:hypothetical protein